MRWPRRGRTVMVWSQAARLPVSALIPPYTDSSACSHDAPHIAAQSPAFGEDRRDASRHSNVARCLQ